MFREMRRKKQLLSEAETVAMLQACTSGVLAVQGELLLGGGCLIYLWGLRALGAMFGPASGLGVALFVGHRLITAGPYLSHSR